MHTRYMMLSPQSPGGDLDYDDIDSLDAALALIARRLPDARPVRLVAGGPSRAISPDGRGPHVYDILGPDPGESPLATIYYWQRLWRLERGAGHVGGAGPVDGGGEQCRAICDALDARRDTAEAYPTRRWCESGYGLWCDGDDPMAEPPVYVVRPVADDGPLADLPDEIAVESLRQLTEAAQ